MLTSVIAAAMATVVIQAPHRSRSMEPPSGPSWLLETAGTVRRGRGTLISLPLLRHLLSLPFPPLRWLTWGMSSGSAVESQVGEGAECHFPVACGVVLSTLRFSLKTLWGRRENVWMIR